MDDHVLLYNSTVCRLCGEENENGTLLYNSDETDLSLNELINSYLPLKVADDGELPRTICPGCAIQLEAVVEFFNLIIKGQNTIRKLHLREKQFKKSLQKSDPTISEVITENIVYEINTTDGVYHVEHPISLQVSGLDKPKRKRGRPPKKPKTEEELAAEMAAEEKRQQELMASITHEQENPDEPIGKRRRKAPTRFREVVQGKELDKILLEEGVIDEADSDPDSKADMGSADNTTATTVASEAAKQEPEIIGMLENSGQLVGIVVTKGKGRGRPKGCSRTTREKCAICGMEFVSVGRYMSHVAQHGPVIYQCVQCNERFDKRISFTEHQKATEHTGQNVILCNAQQENKVVDASQNLLATVPPSMPILSPTKEECDADGATNNMVVVERNVEQDPLSLENTDNTGDVKPVTEEQTEVVEESAETAPKGKPRLKCSLCEKTFSSKQSKSLHFKAAHGGSRAYSCSVCGAAFAYPRSLALHRARHRRDRAFACDLCGKVLNHPSSVVYHKETVHSARQYVCLKCGKWFRHKQLLQRHQLVHSQQRPHTCHECNASFKSRANLVNHQLLHSGVKKFSCDVCHQRFAHKTSLTLHARLHTGVKPFSCGVCGKAFSQKGNLLEHARIHSGERPYKCNVCGRTFTTSSQHRLHVKRHAADTQGDKKCAVSKAGGVGGAGGVSEENVSRTCASCGAVFSQRAAYLRHVRKHAAATTGTGNTKKKRTKQQNQQLVSLLVQEQPPPVVPEEIVPSPVQEVEAVKAEEGDRVIYVTYEDDDTEYHILNEDQMASLQGSELFTNQTLSLSAADGDGDAIYLQTDNVQHIAVQDSDGNPWQLSAVSAATSPTITQVVESAEERATGAVQRLQLHKVNTGGTVQHYFTIV